MELYGPLPTWYRTVPHSCSTHFQTLEEVSQLPSSLLNQSHPNLVHTSAYHPGKNIHKSIIQSSWTKISLKDHSIIRDQTFIYQSVNYPGSNIQKSIIQSIGTKHLEINQSIMLDKTFIYQSFNQST